MDSTSSTHMSILQTPIFSRNNYEYWSLTMKALFIGKDVWEIVQNGYTKPANQMTYNNLTQAKKDDMREQRRKDGKDLFYIHQAMHESILPRVAATKTTKEARDTLETSYQGLDKAKNAKL